MLLQEWVRDIGAPAGLHAQNTFLSVGAIGAPESRLEMEVGGVPYSSAWSRTILSLCFCRSYSAGVPAAALPAYVLPCAPAFPCRSVAEWEVFLTRIHPDKHRAWSQRIQAGDHRWSFGMRFPSVASGVWMFTRCLDE